MKYINLRAYTTASMKFGIFDIDEAIKKTKNNPEEYTPSFAVTERNNMYSVIDFYKSGLKSSDDNFKFTPIVGVELIFAKNHKIKQRINNDSSEYVTMDNYEKYPLLLLAKNNDGCKNIFRLQTLFYKSQKQDKVTEDVVMENKELFNDIFVLSGGNTDDSILFNGFKKYINSDNKEEELLKIKETIKFWKEVTNNNYFIELQRDGTKLENEYIKFILPISIELGVPVVATNNTYFLNRDDYGTHELFRANKSDKKAYFNNYINGVPTATPENYLKSNSEMSELFKDIPIAVENSYAIGKSTSVDFELNKHNYLPEIESPNKEETINQYFTRLSDEGLDELMLMFLDKYVKNSTLDTLPNNSYFNKFSEWYDLNLDLDLLTNEEKLNEIKKTNLYKEYKERLDYEVGVIIKMDFPSYFLVVSDFIKWSKNNDIPVGPGRGSGAGSLVAYSLKITDLDPMQFELLFERFLNPERVSMPDFDIDFSSSSRNQVIEYVRKKYNKDNDIYVSQIMNVGTYDVKSSIEMAAKSYGLKTTHPIVTNIKKLVGVKDYSNEDDYIDEEDKEVQSNNFFEELKDNHLFQVQYKNAPLFRDIIDLASKYYGNMRNQSKHAAGIVISSQRLDSILPLINISGSDVTQLNKDNSEALGVIKFDFLALENLTVMHHALDEINKKRIEQNLDKLTMDDLSKIDIYDSEIYKSIFQKGNTSNVFQFASIGMKNMLVRYKPDCFEDLIALVSLYRPGPMDIIDDYIDTKHGRIDIVDMAPSCPEVKEVLKETYGFIVYQEQVMKIAQVYAGYSYGGADLLRRAMGKKKISEMEKQKDIFISGALKTLGENPTESQISTKRQEAEELFNHMEKFASYGFNKSHAAAYSMISFQTAWFKHYYPKEYLTAVLHSTIRTKKKELVEDVIVDAKTNGVNVVNIDINSSKDNFYIDKNGNIVMPFSLITQFPEILSKRIASIRHSLANEEDIDEDYVFNGVYDFAKKMHENDYNLKPTFLKSLIKVGAFSKLEDRKDTRMLLESSDDFISKIKEQKVHISSNILRSLPSSYIKSAYKTSKSRKNDDDKVKNYDQSEVTLSEELLNIRKLLGFVNDENKIKNLFLNNVNNKNNIIKNNNIEFENIFSNITEIKNNINNLVNIEREVYFESLNSAKNSNNVKIKKSNINNLSLINGVLIDIIESKYKDKFECKFATNDGIHTLISYNKNFLKVDLKLFESYYFLVNTTLAPKQDIIDEENELKVRFEVKDIFQFNNMFDQVVSSGNIIVDKFDTDEENKKFILDIINNVESSYSESEKTNNIKYKQPIKLNVYGESIDLSLSEKIESEFIKNNIFIDITVNKNMLNNNNKINISELYGNVTDVISIDDGLELLKNNKTFDELNKYIDLSTSKTMSSDVAKNYDHLIYGYIKEVKSVKSNIYNIIIIDTEGKEITLNCKDFLENSTLPKLNTNKPALFKVAYNRSSKGTPFIKFKDVYFESNIEEMNLLNKERLVNLSDKDEIMKLISSYDLLINDTNTDIISNDDSKDKLLTIAFETKEKSYKYISNNKIIVKYNEDFVKEIEDNFDAVILFDFNKTYLNPYNMKNNNENKSDYSYVKKEFEKEVTNEHMIILNSNHITTNEKMLNNINISKNKVSDLFNKIEEINQNGEEISTSKDKSVLICATPIRIKEVGSFGKFVSFADSTAVFETKIDYNLENYDLEKMIEDNEPVVMKLNLNLTDNKMSKIIYKNITDVYSMSLAIQNLVKFIVIKTDINNYDIVNNIAKKYKDKDNNNNIQIILKDGLNISNKDSTKEIIATKYSSDFINEVKKELNITDKDDIYINLLNNGVKFQSTIMQKNKNDTNNHNTSRKIKL